MLKTRLGKVLARRSASMAQVTRMASVSMCTAFAGCGGTDVDSPPILQEEAQARPDRTVPSLSITSPTTASTMTTATPLLELAGAAQDNRSVSRVTWSSNSGASGTAQLSGSGSSLTWSAQSIALIEGRNTVTVVAYDAAGNRAGASLTVDYTPAPGTLARPEWVRIATEGQSFAISGTQLVRYGAGSTWRQQSVTAAGRCTNDFFGGDPIVGTVKE